MLRGSNPTSCTTMLKHTGDLSPAAYACFSIVFVILGLIFPEEFETLRFGDAFKAFRKQSLSGQVTLCLPELVSEGVREFTMYILVIYAAALQSMFSIADSYSRFQQTGVSS